MSGIDLCGPEMDMMANDKLRISVGSENKAKVHAVLEILAGYPHLAHAEVKGVRANSGVSDQPLSLDETVGGAMNRARGAFVDCVYSIGIESGLMRVPNTKSGYMHVCVAAIWDGAEFHLGLSSAWEFSDRAIFHSMITEGIDLNHAVHLAGFAGETKSGSKEGIISTLTKGRLDRKAYTKQALAMALIHLERFS